MTKVKICGIKRIEDVAYVNTYKPDYIGFIFAPGRKRTITFEQAQLLKARLDSSINAVGVFIDAPIEEVVHLLQAGVIDTVQLHGHEDAEYVKSLREAYSDVVIVKAFVIKCAQDLEQTKGFPCDYLLLDGGIGQGEVFDWSLIDSVDKPFFLAGGLSADNVAEAIATVHPFAVDVSSNVETDGCKDSKKIKQFIEVVRG